MLNFRAELTKQYVGIDVDGVEYVVDSLGKCETVVLSLPTMEDVHKAITTFEPYNYFLYNHADFDFYYENFVRFYVSHDLDEAVHGPKDRLLKELRLPKTGK